MNNRFFSQLSFTILLTLAFWDLNLLPCLAQNVSQLDSAPLLKKARLSFQSHDLQEGESLLEQYIREMKQQYPSGYTFGYDAACVALDNLDTRDAIEVISKLKKQYQLPHDLALKQGVDAALLKAYKKAKLWSDGVQLIDGIKGEEKTNFVLNITVLDFNRALAAMGKTNEATQVSKHFFGGGADVKDQIMPAGYWMKQNAETDFMLNQQSNGLRILDNIAKISPEYYRTNQIDILLLKVNALERLAKYSEVARELAVANDLLRKDYPTSEPDKKLLQYRLKAYQHAGWLDRAYKANTNQVFTAVPYLKNRTSVSIRIIMIIALLLPPLIIGFIALKKRFL